MKKKLKVCTFITYVLTNNKENETNGEPTEDTTEQTSSGHSVDPLQGKPLAEVFHFWKLAGSNDLTFTLNFGRW